MKCGRALLALLLAGAVLAGFGPGTSCRADAPSEQQPTTHAGEKKDSKEHPKVNPVFPPGLDLGIWTLVVFLLLAFVLGKFAWKPMLQGLRKREETIRLAVDEAKIAREETRRMQAEFQAKMDEAFAKIPKMMDEARRHAEQLRDELKNKALAEIQSERQRLRREVETARDQALQEIWNQAAQLATLISAKAIGRSLNEEDHRRLTEEALDEVRASGGKFKTELRQFGDEWQRQGGGEGA